MCSEQVVSIRQIASTRLPTKWGIFQALVFERRYTDNVRRAETALVIAKGDLTRGAPLLRIHSECLTGELFRSLRCDCADQLDIAMREIAKERCGLVIYEHQEGRGIGLIAKLRAYGLQDAGLDTIDANLALGLAADARDFSLPAAIVKQLGICRVRLLSNNPLKSRAVADAGIVVQEVLCEASPTPHSFGYLRTKKERLGHALTFGDPAVSCDQPADQSGHARIEEALRELQSGRMLVVVDDADRENEGDLVMAAEMITPEAVSFMIARGKGLVCLAMTEARLGELNIEQMVPDSTALGGTAFTVSIDVKGYGVTTGISAHDRAQTIRAAIDPRSRPEDFARPGHVFPLCARAGGVVERRGHTEAAVDLARLAGLRPAAVICEILNDDGSMARMSNLVRFCRAHQLLMVTVADLCRYRLISECEAAHAAIDKRFARS